MRIDLGDTEKQQSDKFRQGTDAFTAALMRHHSDLLSLVVEPEPPKALTPIPNKKMAFACAVAFAPLILNRVEAIQRATLREYPGLTMSDLKAQRRTKTIVRARQIAMYVSKTTTLLSLPDIGRRFGGRDHTTVLHSVRKIEALIAVDMVLAAQIERIKDHIPGVLA